MDNETELKPPGPVPETTEPTPEPEPIEPEPAKCKRCTVEFVESDTVITVDIPEKEPRHYHVDCLIKVHSKRGWGFLIGKV